MMKYVKQSIECFLTNPRKTGKQREQDSEGAKECEKKREYGFSQDNGLG